jgi:hypothetical protein
MIKDSINGGYFAAFKARINLTHVSDSESEININLPSSTAPFKLENP